MLDAKRIYSLTFIIVLLTSATLPIIPMVFAQTSISVSPGTGTSLSVVTVSVSHYFLPEVAENYNKDEPWLTPMIPVSLAKLDDKGKITHMYGLLGVWDEVNDKAYGWVPDSETVWSTKCRIPLQAIPGYKSPGFFFIVLGGDIGTEPIAKASFTVPQLEPLEDIIEDAEPEDIKIAVGFPDWENKPFDIKITTTQGGKPVEAIVSLNIDGELTNTYIPYLLSENNKQDIRLQTRDYDMVFYVNKNKNGELLRTDKNGVLLLSLKDLYSVVLYRKMTSGYNHPVLRDDSRNMLTRNMQILPYLYALTLTTGRSRASGEKINALIRANVETFEVYSSEYNSKTSTENSKNAEVQVVYDYIAKIKQIEYYADSTKVEISRVLNTQEQGPVKFSRDAIVGEKLLPNEKIVLDKNVKNLDIKWIWGHNAYIKAHVNKIVGTAEILIQPTNEAQEEQWSNNKWWRGMEGTLTSGTIGAIIFGILDYVIVTPDPTTKGIGAALAMGGIFFAAGYYVLDQSQGWSSPEYKFYRPNSLLYVNTREDGSCCYVFHGSVDVLTNLRPDELALANPVATVVGGEKVCIDNTGNVDGPRFFDSSELDHEVLELTNKLQSEYENARSTSVLGPDAGLVAYYPFNGDYNDYSGEGNHGSLEGTTSFASGEIGESVYFDGESWINIPDSDSLDLSSSLTFSLWVNKQDAGTGGWSVLFSKADSTALDDSSPYAFAHSIDGLHPLIRLTQNNGSEMFTSNSWTGFNEWHMLTVTWDGKDIKFYNNGEYQDTRVWEGVLPDSDSPLEIGRDQPGSVEYYRGWMDDLRIYNHALSASQVMELYNKQEITPTSSVVVRDDKEQTRDHDTNDEEPSDSTPLDDVLVYVRDYSKTSGSTVSIPVFIENAHNIGNMDFSITYDRSVLNAVGYEKGSLTEGSMVEANILDDEVFVAFTDSDGLNGDGTLIYIKYDVVGDGGERCEVVPKVSTANMAETFDPITVIDSAGMFVVEGLKGDANGDGRITAVDALMALQMAVNRIPEDDICDMNGDGSVSSLDAVLIREKALKG